MKKINYVLFLLIALYVVSCSSDNGPKNPIEGPIIPVNKVAVSFDLTISPNDPYVIQLNNTSQADGDYTAVWDFGKGGEKVPVGIGIEEVRYEETGTYTITLEATNTAGTATESKTILVDNLIGVCPNAICGSPSGDGLKGATETFSVGMITRSPYINAGGQHTQILMDEFNSLTSEYEMKMNVMYPSEGNYDFSAADAIVGFAQANGLDVHGHALIWHNATPTWVENFTGTDAEFEAMVENYISETLTRYKGKVRSWDVVNEALDDSSGHPLRNSVFRQKMGDDYVKKCFQFARNADPDVLLFYNDYNMAASTSKREAMFNLVDNLGDLIDGVGAQMHISIDGPSAANIQAVADGTVSRGLKLHFSELDIRTNPEGDNNVTSLSNAKAEQQKAKFKEVVEIYNAIPIDNKFALTVWGLRDNESWLLDFWGVPDWPLMFDENYNKKQSYQGFIDALQ